MSEPKESDPNDNGVGQHPLAPDAAREQSAEYWGIKTSKSYDVGNGETLLLPHPEFLDDETQLAYDKLKLESESWDHDEVLERDALGQVVANPKTGDPVTRRIMLEPHRKTDADGKVQLVVNFNIQLCQIFWGADGYKKFKAAGGFANQVAVDLSELRIEFQKRARERLTANPKRP